MRDKVVDKIMFKIKSSNNELDDIKYMEIRYGLQTLYTLITKTTVIFVLSILFNVLNEFVIFFTFYVLLRSVGFGSHAKTNLQCWIFSTLLMLGIPYLFGNIYINLNIKIILWSIIFINFIIFAPADTKKRPMINQKRKLKFKFFILLYSLIYLIFIIYFNNISNLILGAMFLEGFLVNPIGYISMGEKVRFHLNDLNIFKMK